MPEHVKQRVYHTPSVTVSKSNSRFEASCNTIIFKNNGTATVRIDSSIRLLPNEGLELTGYPGEINLHSYLIVFEGDERLRLTRELAITCKIYKDEWI